MAKKKSIFWRIYFIYFLVLLLALVGVFFYVRSVMIEYEESSAEEYIEKMLTNAGKNDDSIGDWMQEKCFNTNLPGDPTGRSKEFYKKIGLGNFEIKKDTVNSQGNVYAYNVLSQGKPFLTVWIKEEGSVNKLGILNIQSWSFQGALLRDENSKTESIETNEDHSFKLCVVMPEDFNLLLDGTKYSLKGDENKAELKLFSDLDEYINVPSGVEVNTEGIYFEPEFTVTNNQNEEVLIEPGRDEKYYASVEYGESDATKSIITSALDPVSIGHLWEDFMLDDVGGAKHGFSTVVSECRLLEDSNLYKQAEEWATNVDITFVSDHKKTTKSDDSASNYVMYNDKLCSCDLYFEITVPVYINTKTTDKTVVFNNRMFFYYNQDTSLDKEGWYWVGMYPLDE